jgi:hypothetical protein
VWINRYRDLELIGPNYQDSSPIIWRADTPRDTHFLERKLVLKDDGNLWLLSNDGQVVWRTFARD